MIDVRDLRIGSIVKSPNVKWGMVNKIVEHYDDWAIGVSNDEKTSCLYTITNPNDGNALIKGVPITPEWLEKLGFEERKLGKPFEETALFKYQIGNECGDGIDVVIESNGDSYCCLEVNGGFDSYGDDIVSELDVPCKYIHELQNLIYSLTGKELTIGGEA